MHCRGSGELYSAPELLEHGLQQLGASSKATRRSHLTGSRKEAARGGSESRCGFETPASDCEVCLTVRSA